MNRDWLRIKLVFARVGTLLVLTSLLLVSLACGGGGQQGGGNGGEGGVEFNRPIDMIVPFGPGGGSDQMARLVASAMEEDLGVQVPVTNTPGAAGSTGVTSMLSRPPESAMASFTNDSLPTTVIGSAAFEMDDLQAVCRAQEMPSGILVQGDGPYGNWEELADAARQNPGEIKVATSGQGSIDTVILAALAEAGVKFREVPYADPAERYSALLGGAVDAMYEQPGDLLQQLDSGQMKTVLLFAEEPVEGLKGDYVVSEETGLDVPILNQFRGVLANSETDPEVVKAWSDACGTIQDSKKWQKFQEQNFSLEGSYMTAQEFQAYLDEMREKIENLAEKYDLAG